MNASSQYPALPAGPLSSQQEQPLPPHSENVDQELSRIQSALQAVFAPSNQLGSQNSSWTRQLADRYLTSFQATAVAWQVCDRLLLDRQTASARFFAAQTLHSKCRCGHVRQLPAESLPSLRDSLVTQLSQSAAEPVVATRLAMAVAALAIQMSWTTIVNDLLSLQPRQPWVDQVLKELPEECASDRLLLEDENRRYAMRDQLVTASPLVLQQPQPNFSLWHAWIRYVPIPPGVFCMPTCPVLPATLHALQSWEKHANVLEPALDVLVEILRMYPSHMAQNQSLIQLLLPQILNLPLEKALQSDDSDVVRAYCRMMTELGESYLNWIVQPGSETEKARQVVNWILWCSSRIQDTEISGMTLHFWYRFVMYLESMEPLQVRQDMVDMYNPYLLQLLDSLVTSHIKYPDNLEDLSKDIVDDIHRHRYFIAETLEDCCRLLGGPIVLDRVGQRLKKETSWQELEATLFCLQSVHRYIPSDESLVLPQCMALLLELPPDLLALRFTASQLVGKYASWLAKHPEHLEPLLPYLAQGLSEPKCATAAAIAIKELCEVIALGESILLLYQQVMTQLALSDELEILEGVCRTISKQADQETPEAMASYLTRLVQPIGTRWTTALSDPKVSPTQLMGEVDRLTVLVRFLRMSRDVAASAAAIVQVMHSTWSLLQESTRRFPHDTMLAEKVCRLHKHALRSCGADAYAPLLDSLLQTLGQSFVESHQSPYLYGTSICITEYGRKSQYVPKLFEVLELLARTTFSFLRTLEELTAHPDVVEELFYLMGRTMSYCPEPLAGNAGMLTALFEFAMVGMELDHRNANRGTLNFLEATVSFATRSGSQGRATLLNTLQQQGQGIVTKLVRALMGDLPAYGIDSGKGSIAGILFKLNMLMPDILRQEWLPKALQHAPERSRAEFLGAFDAPNIDDFNMGVRAFRSACEQHQRFKSGTR